MRFVAGRGADKVCCRQRRCSEAVAGREPSAQRTAGRGRCGGEPSGKYCRPGALRRRAIGKMLPAGGAAAESHREDVAGRGRCWRDGAKRKSERKSLPLRKRRCDATDAQKALRCNRCTEAAPLGARKKRRASTDLWHRKSNPAQRLVTPMPAAQEK